MNLAAFLEVQDLWHTVYGPVFVVSEAVLQVSSLGPAGIPLAAPISCHKWHRLQESLN